MAGIILFLSVTSALEDGPAAQPWVFSQPSAEVCAQVWSHSCAKCFSALCAPVPRSVGRGAAMRCSAWLSPAQGVRRQQGQHHYLRVLLATGACKRVVGTPCWSCKGTCHWPHAWSQRQPACSPGPPHSPQSLMAQDIQGHYGSWSLCWVKFDSAVEEKPISNRMEDPLV